MRFGDEIARVRTLSDGALLSELKASLGASRRSVAEVVTHLGEVEERRLHLLAGHESMFMYCVARLHMSEDEAYRRIEVARLCRRFPRLLERLAAGKISLSVAALLRSHLTPINSEALMDDVSEKTVAAAREVLARWFPRADVPCSIRKLPEARRPVAHVTGQMELADQAAPDQAPTGTRAAEDPGTVTVAAAPRQTVPVEPHASPVEPRPVGSAAVHAGGVDSGALHSGAAHAGPVRSSAAHSGAVHSALIAESPPANVARPPAVAGPAGIAPPPARPAPPSLQPLSPARYRVQFTGSAELKRKLELARDLLRHAIPSGDLATIVERALDLLLEQTMKRRFGAKTRKATGAQPASPPTDRPESERLRPPPAADSSTSDSRTGGTRERQSSDDARTSDVQHAGGPLVEAPLVEAPHLGTPHANAQTFAAAHAGAAHAGAAHVNTPHVDAQNVIDTPRADAQTFAAVRVDAQRIDAKTDDAKSRPAKTNDIPQIESEPISAQPLRAPDVEGQPVETTRRAPPPNPRHIPHSVRREVSARDGLRCTWQAPDGTRCNARAWLEHDHITPRGQGGNNDARNGRTLCRAHNRLAAEQAYGQRRMARVIARERARRHRRTLDGAAQSRN